MVITVSEVYVMELDTTKWNHDKEAQPYGAQYKLVVLTYCTGCGDDVKSAYWLVVLFPKAFWVAQLLLLRPLISHALEGMRMHMGLLARFQSGSGRESCSLKLFTVLAQPCPLSCFSFCH